MIKDKNYWLMQWQAEQCAMNVRIDEKGDCYTPDGIISSSCYGCRYESSYFR